MDTAIKVPLSERINLRLIVFAGIVLFLIGVPSYIFVREKITGGIRDLGNGLMQVDLKAMSTFNFDQEKGTINDVPPQWRALDGKKVVLYGEIWTGNSAAPEIASFDLVYSIAKCCFSGPPQIQHFVQSKVARDKTIDYYPGLVKVTGTLHVNVIQGEGKVDSVYQLDVDSVEPG